jgi:hypothetical protein
VNIYAEFDEMLNQYYDSKVSDYFQEERHEMLQYLPQEAMSDAVIRVENLSKKYTLSHQQEGRSYKSLRDGMAEGAQAIGDRLWGRGPVEDATREEFWVLKDVISNESPFIANWHPNWGNIVFTDVKLEISSRQSTCV